MAGSHTDRCAKCGLLHSLPVESGVIVLTLLHVVANLAEQLIHLQVIQVPVQTTSSDGASQSTTSAPINSSTSDPGGTGDSGCGEANIHDHLKITVQVLRYVTLVISGFFTLEIICKIIYQKKEFLKDFFQVFDLLVILASLAAEIAFFLLHDWFLCVHVAVEICSYVIILRLWRIPRVCNIRKKEYVSRLEDEMKYLRITKIEVDKSFKEMQTKYQLQSKEVEQLRVQLKGTQVIGVQSQLPNGNGPHHGLTMAVEKTLSESKLNVPPNNNVSTYTNGHVQRGDGALTDRSYPTDETENSDVRARNGNGRASPVVIPSDDVFADSDGSETPVHVQKVQVQIEEVIHQNKLPSISISRTSEEDVLEEMPSFKKDEEQPACYVNDGYDEDEEEGRGTYRSADGIPITEL